MISDGLTKWFGNKKLQRALIEGLWSLKDTDEAIGLRQVAADQRRRPKINRTDKGGVCENKDHSNPIGGFLHR